MVFGSGSDSKESACNAGDLGSVPGLGRFPGGGHGNPLQCSCLENSHEQRNLEDYSPWGCKESDSTEQLSTQSQWDGLELGVLEVIEFGWEAGGRAPCDGAVAVIRGHRLQSSLPSMWGHSGQTAIHESGKAPSSYTKSANTLIWESSEWRTMRNKNDLFKPPSLQYFCLSLNSDSCISMGDIQNHCKFLYPAHKVHTG